MTTSWKRTETASGAGANALSAAFCVHVWPESRLVRALRWKQDAVCRETVSADATSVQTEADSTDLIPHSNSTNNPKGNPKHNPEKERQTN